MGSVMDKAMEVDQRTTVLLVNMPFAALFRPSIGLSLLKAGLERVNIPARIHYFTFLFAELTGTSLYIRIANQEPRPSDLVGEWIFSEALFGKNSINHDLFLDLILRKGDEHGRKAFVDELIATQMNANEFVNRCLDVVLSYDPEIIGFTSTFQQHAASLALAKRIKEVSPEKWIVFGGANCEGVMGAEAARQFPFVDAFVSGEGDLVFPELVHRMLAVQPFDDLRGVYTHPNTFEVPADHRYASSFPIRNMDSLPVPDYDEYFKQLNESRLDVYYQPRILFESSRGCWWGAKSHCTFCGLNGETIAYRSKSQKRALQELIHLTKKYPDLPVSAVDNILDMKYFKEMIPELAEHRINVEMFYEVKANLKKEHVLLLRDAGVTEVQPGIESFSSEVLELMGKGIKGLQNIQLLKWCKEFAVRPSWNILCGFPGESPEEYARMAALIPLISHLPPPEANGRIRLDRFSPNFENAGEYGFFNVKPYPAYQYVYQFEPTVLSNLAYYFTFEYGDERNVEAYTAPLAGKVSAWQRDYQYSDLFSVDIGYDLLIWDLRPEAPQLLTRLTGLQKALYVLCDRISTRRELEQSIHEIEDLRGCTVDHLLEPLLDNGLMLKEGNAYLSLAIPLGVYSPSHIVLQKFNDLLNQLGNDSSGNTVISVANCLDGCRSADSAHDEDEVTEEIHA